MLTSGKEVSGAELPPLHTPPGKRLTPWLVGLLEQQLCSGVLETSATSESCERRSFRVARVPLQDSSPGEGCLPSLKHASFSRLVTLQPGTCYALGALADTGRIPIAKLPATTAGKDDQQLPRAPVA